MEYHRAQIRKFFGFRECTVADADKLGSWLAEEVCQRERRPERVRERLLGHCREQGIEQSTPGRLGRIIGSGLRQAEKALVARVTSRIPTEVAARMNALVTEAGDVDDEEITEANGRTMLAQIKADPGNVSLATTREEIAKLTAIRAIGLPADVFTDVAPKVLAGWRDRAAVETPSHLCEDHPPEITLTLLAALLHCRGREITDTLVDLLIATVHRINARAERRVVDEFVADLKRVTGKENILFRISEAAVSDPDGLVREVVYPAAGGVGTLLDLIAEYKSKGKRGVLIYWTVERNGAMAVHSQLLSCSASEVHAMVEGAMRHGTDMRIESNFVDSHGASFIGFGITRLLGFDLMVDVLGEADRRGVTPLFTSNMTPYGDIQLDTSRRLNLGATPQETTAPGLR